MKRAMGFGAALAMAASPGLAAPPLVAASAARAEGAQATVIPHPDPLSLLADADPAIAANKRLVFDMWRRVVNAGQVEQSDRLLQPDYMQHSPMLPTGRDAFKAIFSVVKRVDPAPELVSPPLVTILGEGALVVMALREEMPEPVGGGRYATTHFNLFRVKEGRLAEHWHSVQGAPGPTLPPFGRGGPHPVTGATGDAQTRLLAASTPALAANKTIAVAAWRRAIDGGSASEAAFAADYVDHDPNASSERRGFDPGTAGAPSRSSEVPLVAVVAAGDLVVIVSGRRHPHPHRAGDTYTTTWFDMMRIGDGRIAEHWNGAIRKGAALPRYGN